MSTQKRQRLADVAESENRRLATDPNVVAVGYGLRQRGGKGEYEVCIQYHVKKKIVDLADIHNTGSQPIPAEVGGYPTDVVELTQARPLRNDGAPTGSRGSHIEKPLIGGVSTTVLSDWHSFPTGFGTLGGLCFDRSTGDAMAISNAHVWGLDTGKDCIQPWMPTGEYVEAVVKLLTCGPAAFILDTTVPSPLTVGLSAAAAAAWAAAAASDAEDPSRWGQRTGTVPPLGARTTLETVLVAAPVPDFPFAGRAYTTKASWDYTRHTTDGDFRNSIVEDRPNEHVLVGKLVWTQRDAYRPGERVHICAELISGRISDPGQFFVVAVCYPNSNPNHLVYRVLRPGRCKELPRAKPVCLRGFPDPLPSGGGSGYTINLDPFRFESGEPTRTVPAPAGSLLQGTMLLELPATSLRVVFPPSTRVEFEVLQTKHPVSIIGRNSAGRKVSSATGSGPSMDPETLMLEASEMVEAVISGGSKGGAFLAGICVSKQPRCTDLEVELKLERGSAMRSAEAVSHGEEAYHLCYVGDLDLGPQEQKDRWNIVLQVQSLDPSSPQGDPIEAAHILGGIPSATNALVVGCITIMLLDHVFDVI